ncbi:uncharacterized protein FA14DRAFT_183619 [Meira miltonrushii]|uniref:ALMS motif domain-containing protein n=1 Tax=Meira miltonrushii TaxID=1280837 RepID=A0A316VQI5_9BASI|nr:uncharacterized protein FA14DRAFT_183619 [Meira miltonrushii]PWN37755.1 hypothetical protein FA14DRAFT_183619 [Meira miltonrushii]
MSIMFVLYLLGLLAILCKASSPDFPPQMSRKRNSPPLDIDLNMPPAIESSHASMSTNRPKTVMEGAEGTSQRKKKFRSPQAIVSKLERDREYRARFSKKKVNEVLPSLNEQQKNKLLALAEKKRMQARVRQQKQRDLRKERIKNGHSTERDAVNMEKDRTRKRMERSAPSSSETQNSKSTNI